MRLQDAFGVARGDVVAFIGAGGKTTALITMGYELSDDGWRVLATTSTHIREEQLRLMPHALHHSTSPEAISAALSDYGFVFIYDTIRDGKVYGTALDWTKQLLDTVDSDVLLVEADEAGGRPLKAPYEDEPHIPQEVSLVIPIISLDALNKPLNDEYIYNPQAVIERYGFQQDGRVRLPWIAQIWRDEELGLRGIPDNARVVGFLNRTPETGYLRARARLIAKMALRSPRFQGIALGSVRASNPVMEVQRTVGAVVLAAESSFHMGEPTVLLPWENSRNIIEHILHLLIRSRVEPLRVVTGYDAPAIKDCVKPMGVRVVHNRSYKTGGALSALKAGLRAMPDHVSAALIVQGNQPRLEPRVLHRLLQAYAEGEGDIIAPYFQTHMGYPILLARRYWSDFLSLRRKQALETLWEGYRDETTFIHVNTDSIHSHVETPDDYEAERYRAGLRRLNRSYRKPDAS